MARATATLVVAAVAFSLAAAARERAAVRRDWRTLSGAERKQFTDAVNTLKLNKADGTMPARSYDSLVYDHREAYRTPCPWPEMGEEPDMYYRNGDQKGPAFLPWHRQQLMLLEKALQEVSGDDTLAVPYWNYMVDSFKAEPAATPLWSADRGIGGDGRAEDGVVADGPFSFWPLKYADLGETYLERSLGRVFSHPGDAADFLPAFEETRYDEPPYSAESKGGFRNYIEGFHKFAHSEHVKGQVPGGEGAGGLPIQLHAAAHAFVGRSMINSTSPNDPAFFMLHAFTDALWESWQVAQLRRFPDTTVYDHFEPHGAGEGPVHHTLHEEMVQLDGVTPADVLEFERLPYSYDKLPVPAGIYTELLAANATRTRAQGGL